MTSASSRSSSFTSSRASRLLSSIPAATASPCPPSMRPSAWSDRAVERHERRDGRRRARIRRAPARSCTTIASPTRRARGLRPPARSGGASARRATTPRRRPPEPRSCAGHEAGCRGTMVARPLRPARGPRAARPRARCRCTTTSCRRGPSSPASACVSSAGASTRSATRPRRGVARADEGLGARADAFESRVHLLERAVSASASCESSPLLSSSARSWTG